MTVTVSGEEKLQEGFEKAPKFTHNQLQRAIKAALLTIDKNATDQNFQFKTPRSERTGRLQQSFSQGIDLPQGNSLTGSIGPTVKYAKFVHEGTGPFRIKPKSKKALDWPGADHPVKSVRHPGIEANPFMPRIAKAAEPEIKNKHFKTALQRIANKIAE